MPGKSRFKKLFSSAKSKTGSPSFEYYYAAYLRDQPEGGVHIGDARRDFEDVRRRTYWVRTCP